MLKKLLIALGVLVGVLVLAIAIAIVIFDEPRPSGTAGPEADALARRMIAWTKPDQWAATGAVQWSFGGRHQLLWDRERGYVRVRWEPYEVLLRLSTQSGIVRVDGVQAKGARAGDLLEKAYALFINDSFWLNPFEGIFDPSTRRELVETPAHGDALLVTYGSGGVTPGDSYLWLLGPEGEPRAWKMWVEILPVGGIEVSWDDWIDLSTGAKISTLHRGPVELRLGGVKGAATLAELLDGAPDPFADLVYEAPAQAGPTAQPASRPRTSTSAPSASGAASIPAPTN